MSEVHPRDILLRVSPKMVERYQSLAVAGAGRGRAVPLPYTFTRAAPSASYIDRDGTLRLAGVNKPRIEWVDLDGDGIRETPGILLEGGRTNGWDRSEELDHANWVKAGATVVANDGTTGADGGLTSDFLKESALNEIHGFTRTFPALTDNTRSTVSIMARASSRFWLRLITVDKANVARSTWVNFATGAVGTTNAGHVVLVSPLNIVSSQFWRRVSVGFDAASGATTPQLEVYLATGDGGAGYAGDGASGLSIMGMQIEVDKPFPGSYIKTTTAAVTRAADSLTVPFNFGPMDLTVLARVARPAHADASGALGSDPGVWRLGSSGLPTAYTRFVNGAREMHSVVDTATSDALRNAALPAGATINLCTQIRLLTTGGFINLDSGSGFVGEVGPASAVAAWSNQILKVGDGVGGGATNELYGVLLDLPICRGLFTKAEMEAVP